MEKLFEYVNLHMLCSFNWNRPRREEAIDTFTVRLLSLPLSEIEPKN